MPQRRTQTVRDIDGRRQVSFEIREVMSLLAALGSQTARNDARRANQSSFMPGTVEESHQRGFATAEAGPAWSAEQ